MTISEIRAALNNYLDDQADTYGENTTLSSSDNTLITDGCASQLEIVNPNHDYPPKPRH